MKQIMKRKGFLLVIIMILSFSLVACGETKVSLNANANENENEMNNNANIEEAEEEEAMDEAMAEEASLDSNLMGIELLSTLSTVQPKTLKMEAETNSFGMSMSTITYVDGNKTRLETDMGELGTSITINLPDENVVYYYEKGKTQGTKITDISQEDAMEEGYISNDSELFAEITNSPSNNIIARVEVLDGEEVVYIEATEADEDMGEMLVKMWYSVKYATPLKYELISAGDVLASYKVTSIEMNTKLDGALFAPPADVEFLDVDMSGMFEGEMFDLDMGN